MKDEQTKLPPKTPVFQLVLDDKKKARVDRCKDKVHVKSRAAFAEHALDWVMPLIEAGKVVNLNGKLVLVQDLPSELNVA